MTTGRRAEDQHARGLLTRPHDIATGYDCRLVTTEEMRRIEKDCGIPTFTLMEQAGAAIAAAAAEFIEHVHPDHAPIVVVAGKGNNGGDGYAAAAELKAAGRSVTVAALSPVASLAGDAAAMATRARDAGVVIVEVTDEALLAERLPGLLARAALVVDAVLGTGARPGKADPVFRAFVHLLEAGAMKAASGRVLSVDVPSGILGDTGQALTGIDDAPCAVRAAITLTLGRPKPGLYLFPGAQYAGEVRTATIGIPGEAFTGARGAIWDRTAIAALLPRRSPLAHKGHARVLVIGGATGMRGAAALAASSALRSGAGYVVIASPSTTPETPEPVEAVRRPLPGTPEGRYDASASSTAGVHAAGMHAVVLGNGLGRGPAEQRLAEVCTRSLHIPVVVDADALMQISPDSANMAAGRRILTPHAGEFVDLFGGTIASNEEDRVGRTVRAASMCGQVVVFKGRPTVIAGPDGRYAINATGNELLATCGSGDVLAGIIGALVAQGLAPFEAAACGAYLHGVTADTWPHAVGLTAGDMAAAVPAAWTTILRDAGLWPSDASCR